MVDARAGAELVVLVGGRTVGLPLTDVSEVISLGDLTPVPGAGPAIRGLIHFRGQLVPVVDLCRAAFAASGAELLVGAPLVVVEAQRADRGVLRAALSVDRVLGLAADASDHVDVGALLEGLAPRRRHA